jgi:carbonic anhydrase
MDSINSLVNGFRRFTERYYHGGNQLYNHLKTSQQPKLLVIACSDSRVDPAILFDSIPGEIFVIRNVANIVPPSVDDGGTHGVSAALEFAVCSLNVEHIVVLGHSGCGGIAALLRGAHGKFIQPWMKIAEEATKDIAPNQAHMSSASSERKCEQSAVRLSLRNLLTFAFIQERVEDARLSIHGWYFDIGSGELMGYDTSAEQFVTLASSDRGL